MTDLNRFERRLPDLMAELSPPRVPDYFDDMLQATARTRQRPAWASLERWLPMELTARPAPFGLPSWRPLLATLVLVALLVATGAVLLAGSRPKLPPLFGPAGNGAVIYSTTSGDILSLDPATGKAVTIIGGSSDDRWPGVSPDGQRLLFVRLSQPAMLYTANIDGSGIQLLASAEAASWNDWSPNGQQLLYIAEGGGKPFIRDFGTGTTRELPVTSDITRAQWLTDDRLLLITDIDPGPTLGGASRSFATINADGSSYKPLTTPDACCSGNVRPGGNLLTWTSWGAFSNTQGRIHVLDLATGIDRMLPSTDKPGFHFLDGAFSPDGTWLLVKRHEAGIEGVQLGLVASDGTGVFQPIGRRLPKNDSEIRAAFSPDGTQLLMSYDDGSSLLYAIPGGERTEVDWAGIDSMSWQRLAVRE